MAEPSAIWPTTDQALKSATRIATIGMVAVVGILAVAAVLLFMNLPDADAFNAGVEQLFFENDDLSSDAEIKLLEILAQSGTSFAEVITSYRMVIFVLLLFSSGLLVAAVAFG